MFAGLGYAARHARRVAEEGTGLRYCNCCEKVLPLSAFYQQGYQLREFWKPAYMSRCKECIRPLTRENMRRRRASLRGG